LAYYAKVLLKLCKTYGAVEKKAPVFMLNLPSPKLSYSFAQTGLIQRIATMKRVDIEP